MSNNFMYKNNTIITFHDDDNNIWFRGKDVALALKYKNTRKAISDNVDEEDKLTRGSFEWSNWEDPLTNNEKNTIYINESGLYSLILRSKLKSAKKFKRWITSEVLPSIRKTGQYKIPLPNEETMLKIELQKVENEKFRLQLDEKKYMKELYDDSDDVRLQTAAKDYLLSKMSIKAIVTEWSRDISDISKQEFGKTLNHTEKIKFGQYLKRNYVKQFKKSPGKTRRWVNDSFRLVNAYNKDKEKWIIELYKQYFKQ